MFAIFKNKKQISEQVSAMAIASELLGKHRGQEPSATFEVKARVKRINSSGIEQKTKAGKNSYQWVTLDEYNKRLREQEQAGLF